MLFVASLPARPEARLFSTGPKTLLLFVDVVVNVIAGSQTLVRHCVTSPVTGTTRHDADDETGGEWDAGRVWGRKGRMGERIFISYVCGERRRRK